MPTPCTCCSCDPAIPPDPDPYCRQHSSDGVVMRQCDVHGFPAKFWITNPLTLVSVQQRLAGVPDPS